MNDKERAAMQQALEALELFGIDDMAYIKSEKAITALREALAEQVEQEPVAWSTQDIYKDGVFVKRQIKASPDSPWVDYAAPVRTKDLTEEDINELWNTALMIADPTAGNLRFKFARAVIAADRGKNK